MRPDATVAHSMPAMFCSTELAARVERAECRMLTAACEHVRLRLPGLLAAPIAGGIAVHTEPGSPLNKVAGLGFAPFDVAPWVAIEAAHADRGAAMQVEISTLGDPAVATMLSARGFRLVGVENVSARVLTAAHAAPVVRPDLTIRACGPGELECWVETAVAGFLAADTQGVAAHESFERDVLARIVRDFAAAAGVTLFVARFGERLAGAAAMRIDGDLVQLSGASTLPEFRRRGVQSAFLQHRLAYAARAGCELAVVTAQPGSKSQQNMQRHGFQLVYARNVLRREPG